MNHAECKSRCRDTFTWEVLNADSNPPRHLPPQVRKRAQTKLVTVLTAYRLEQINIYPKSRLKKIQGLQRQGLDWYSLRVNDQWRIFFVWDAHRHCAIEVQLSKHNYDALKG